MLPMLPVYLMYLAAETEQGKRASVVNIVGFVAGFTLLFMALGATATAIGAALDAHRLLLQRASGLVILIFGLHFLGVFRIGFLDVEKKLEVSVRRRGFIGALLFGAAFSLGWTPCLGPFLGSALMLARARRSRRASSISSSSRWASACRTYSRRSSSRASRESSNGCAATGRR